MKDQGIAPVVILITTPFIMVATALMNGWAITKLWAWFIASTFHLQTLSIPQGIGLAMTISFITYQFNGNDEKPDAEPMERWLIAVSASIIRPLITVFVGNIVTHWL